MITKIDVCFKFIFRVNISKCNVVKKCIRFRKNKFRPYFSIFFQLRNNNFRALINNKLPRFLSRQLNYLTFFVEAFKNIFQFWREHSNMFNLEIKVRSLRSRILKNMGLSLNGNQVKNQGKWRIFISSDVASGSLYFRATSLYV